MLESRVDGVDVKTFAYLADDAFVTEFYRGKELLGYWDGIAALDEHGHVDQKALEAFHQANCDIYQEDPDGAFPKEG